MRDCTVLCVQVALHVGDSFGFGVVGGKRWPPRAVRRSTHRSLPTTEIPKDPRRLLYYGEPKSIGAYMSADYCCDVDDQW